MRFTSAAGTLVLGAAAVLAKELPKDELKAVKYDSGEVMDKMMMKKFAHWDSELEVGAMNSSQWPRLDYTKCVNGLAQAIPGDPHHTFRCKNFDLYDFINHATLGSALSDSAGRTGSSAWGWVDPKSGREFAVSGMFQGTAFIEILKTGRMVQLAFLPPKTALTRYALWKEIRSYKNFMLIGSELEKSGVQIFDMTKLLTMDASNGPVLLGQGDLTGHIDDLPLGRSHTITVNEELNYVVANGASPRNDTCGAGLIFFDLTDPSKPTRMGCDGTDGYVHDSQCLIYRGPDVKYQGRDICYGYNEDTLTIYDVTDKKNTKVISRTSYEGATYTHQGWVNDKNWQEYIFLDDEIDEEEFAGPAADQYPVTYIFDIRNLEAPKQTGLYKAANIGIDHNQYVIDGLNYQANYGAGLRVYDVSSILEDPTGNSVCEVGFFDIFPEDDTLPGNGNAVYSGTWATYLFPSGFNFINTIERGAFLVKMTKKEKCKPKTCNADNCLRAMRANTIPGRLEESRAFCGEFTKSFIANVTLVKDYAVDACKGNVISRVSSACSCVLPTATAV